MALSQSKVPPQQGNCLLDLFDISFGFGAHGILDWADDIGREIAVVKTSQ